MNLLRICTATVMVICLSSCAASRMPAWSPSNPILETAPAESECNVVLKPQDGQAEQKVKATCETLLRDDLVEIIIEYRRACVAAGGTPDTCFVSVRGAR